MSGLVKGVKKVVKKAVNFVKKNWKTIAMAVAVYFTAGVALSYFPSTAAFSASMPGFGTGGIFSKAAVWMGFNGVSGSGLYGTALMQGKVGAAVGAATGGIKTQSVARAYDPLAEVATTGVKKKIVAGQIVQDASSVMGGSTLVDAAAGAAGAAGTESATTTALIKALNTQTKLSAIKMGFDIFAGLTAPDPDELDESAHARRNAAAFGVGRDGNDAFGWGQSNSAAGWSDMNKRTAQSQVGYGQPSGQSEFRDSPFLPTSFESENPYGRMPEPSDQDFIQPGYGKGGMA